MHFFFQNLTLLIVLAKYESYCYATINNELAV